MNLSILKNVKLPSTPGVYFFRDSKNKILYIGKATSLKNRVRSYFDNNLKEKRGLKLVQMMELASKIDFEESESVLEALLLEAKLIRKHLPIYNTDGKDDKSYNCIVITKEDYPRVIVEREKNLDMYPKNERLYLAGPFPKGGSLREAMQIIRRIFPFRDKCIPNSGKKCFNAQIGLCSGVCDGSITKEDYMKLIKRLILFLDGKKNKVLSELQKEMMLLAKAHEFEKASLVRSKINSLKHINDIALYKRNTNENSDKKIRIEAYDVAHLSGDSMVGVMVVIEDGIPNKKEYRSFNIKTVAKSNDPKALKEMLMRRFKHSEWIFPKLIVVDGNNVQINVAKEVLESYGLSIPVVSIVKDDKHKAREILGIDKNFSRYRDDIILSNAESHRFSIKLHKQKRDKKFLFTK